MRQRGLMIVRAKGKIAKYAKFVLTLLTLFSDAHFHFHLAFLHHYPGPLYYPRDSVKFKATQDVLLKSDLY